jgi:hypothetical protein
MLNTIDTDLIVDRYLAVWSEPDDDARRKAVAELWAPDGVEFIEGTQFRGHEELVPRVAEAYEAFVGNGTFTVASAGDAAVHDDIVTFTIQLIARSGDEAGQVAWAARVFLVLDLERGGLIREDYHLTVKALAE